MFDAHPDVACVDRLALLPDRPGLYGVPVTVFDRLPDPCWRVRGLFTSGTHSYGMGAPMVGGRERFARVLYGVPVTVFDRLPDPCWRVRGLFTSGTHSYGMGAPMVGGRERFARVLVERLPD